MPHRALIATAIALAPVGAVAVARADDPNPAPKTLDLVATPTGGGQIDNRPKGVSPGDAFVEHGTIADASGHALGTYSLTGELVAGGARRGTEQSTIVVVLRDGQLVSEGGHATVSRFSQPIVGGTGAYAGAGGTLTIAPGAHGTEHGTIVLEG